MTYNAVNRLSCNEELLAKAREYVDGKWEELGDAIPSIAGMALYVGMRRETCHLWVKDPNKEEFINIVSDLMAKQERVLLTHGLRGTYNPSITKVVLTKHGYSDRVDQNHTSSDGSMTPPTRIVIEAAGLDDRDD